ncbi:hypothetical protein HGRIS_008211 [Hohenbuehelia grisea]|uniref:Uncharacterized protein n=1 Tax=Hohenbuehelia grisea TaxID=104357 RepID=A0ABR3J7Q2_9AGAR
MGGCEFNSQLRRGGCSRAIGNGFRSSSDATSYTRHLAKASTPPMFTLPPNPDNQQSPRPLLAARTASPRRLPQLHGGAGRLSGNTPTWLRRAARSTLPGAKRHGPLRARSPSTVTSSRVKTVARVDGLRAMP